MTKEIKMKKDHISFSQIVDFMNCRRRYKRKHIDGKKQASNFPMEFGSMQHNVVQKINEVIMASKENISFEDVEQIFETEFKKYHFDLAAYQKGKENMRAYTLKTVAEKSIILKAEYAFRIELKGGAVIEGRIDRVDACGADQIEIIDFKSGAMIPSKEELQRSLQHGIYAFVIWREFPEIKEFFVSHQSLDCNIGEDGTVSGGIKQKVKKDIVQIQDVEPFLELIWERMQAERDFLPSPDVAAHCQYCDEKCDEYFALLQATTGDAHLDDINAVGKQYIQVKNQLSSLNAKDKTLKEMLKIHFDTNLMKELVVGEKLIYVETCHKNAEEKVREAYDYTKLGVTNHLTAAGSMAAIAGALKKYPKEKKGKKIKK